ncbi:RNA polymerase sigma factor [Paenibacillus oceani]|uniref:RNA polymerase sigma factor n=1 Tax=Paenibacillus oceani TaxID=2772510 RepID=A0A927CCQ8_9BACL|nr:RNA polymerase sigma factor [Paenibacillus oceani]MBD2864387.1 RNA polymerase sigma factor [Paenibacillus oceani]
MDTKRLERSGFGPSAPMERFDQLRPELMRYCLKITRCRWDAEDLLQEATIRVIRSLEANPGRALSKSFLYRIAANMWIDQLRKKRLVSEPLDEEHDRLAVPETEFDTRELLEVLADRLSPKYLVILLLMDVFDFTAKETAYLLTATEGSVQITISRARSKLKSLSCDRCGERGHVAKRRCGEVPIAGGRGFESLVEAFRNRDPLAIYSAYVELSGKGNRVPHVKTTAGKLFLTFGPSDGSRRIVSS